jgi:hypothetical protein
MRKISRENTLVRKFSLVAISTVEKKFAKTQAFDWFRYFVTQNTSIWLASLFPFRNGVETNSTTRRREIFRRETFQNHVAHAFKLFARNFSHFRSSWNLALRFVFRFASREQIRLVENGSREKKFRVVIYRKPPTISPGLIYFRKRFLMGLYKGGAYIRVGLYMDDLLC